MERKSFKVFWGKVGRVSSGLICWLKIKAIREVKSHSNLNIRQNIDILNDTCEVASMLPHGPQIVQAF